MNYAEQRRRCAKNIKLGDSFLVKDLDGREIEFKATIIIYAHTYEMYLLGSNEGGSHFWEIARYQSSIDQYRDKAVKVSNLTDYKFAWWYHIDELKTAIMNKIK